MKHSLLSAFGLAVLVPLLTRCTTSTLSSFDIFLLKQDCQRTSNSSLYCKNTVPQKLPPWTRKITIEYTTLTEPITIPNGTFTDRSYLQITSMEVVCGVTVEYGIIDLEFGQGCFTGLDRLEILQIKVNHILLSEKAFDGLPALTKLAFYDCLKMNSDQFLSAFATNSLLKLETLIVQGSFLEGESGVVLSTKFWKAVSKRPIFYLDFSRTEIQYFNFTAFVENCDKVKVTKVAHANFDGVSGKYEGLVCRSLKVIDISYTTWPSKVFHCKSYHDLDLSNWPTGIDSYSSFRYVKSFIADALCPVSGHSNGVQYVNITHLRLKTNFSWQVEELAVRNTNVQTLDLGLDCNTPNIHFKKIDFSNNTLEYISPNLLQCLSRLEYLDLSKNYLYKMSRDNSSLFEQILWPFLNLRLVSFSGNQIEIIPKMTFIKNKKLEQIDLSNNRIVTINFSLSAIFNLHVLNLSSNLFTTIDTSSKTLFQNWMSVSSSWSVDLSNNPLSCFDCNHLELIRWAQEHSFRFVNRLTCFDTNRNEFDMLRRETLFKFKKICNGRIVTVICTVTFCGMFGIFGIMVFVINKQKKIILYKRLLNRIKKKGLYAVFVYCHREDLVFVTDNIYSPLQKLFSDKLNTRENVVAMCKGDSNGNRTIMGEIGYLTERSYVVLVVLSELFVKERFCITMFESFVNNGTPVVLISKDASVTSGKVDLPSEVRLFRNRHKILAFDENNKVESLSRAQSAVEKLLTKQSQLMNMDICNEKHEIAFCTNNSG